MCAIVVTIELFLYLISKFIIARSVDTLLESAQFREIASSDQTINATILENVRLKFAFNSIEI